MLMVLEVLEVLMMALRCQIKREEHIMVVLAPPATDEWLNEVPVGILSLALSRCCTAFQRCCAFQCFPSLALTCSRRWVSNMTDMSRAGSMKLST